MKALFLIELSSRPTHELEHSTLSMSAARPTSTVAGALYAVANQKEEAPDKSVSEVLI